MANLDQSLNAQVPKRTVSFGWWQLQQAQAAVAEEVSQAVALFPTDVVLAQP